MTQEIHKKYNLIIIDDHKMFAESLEIILQEKYNIVLLTDDGNQVLNYLKQPDLPIVHLVLMDLEMPKMGGIVLHKLIKEKCPLVKTIVLSTHNTFKKTESLMGEAVNGYIIKSANRTTLLEGVEKVLKGESFFSPEIKATYHSALKESKNINPTLRGREKEVLKYIAQEYTTQEIAEKMCLSKHTVETYRKNLMLKLNVKNMAGLTKWAIKLGLIPYPEII